MVLTESEGAIASAPTSPMELAWIIKECIINTNYNFFFHKIQLKTIEVSEVFEESALAIEKPLNLDSLFSVDYARRWKV